MQSESGGGGGVLLERVGGTIIYTYTHISITTNHERRLIVYQPTCQKCSRNEKDGICLLMLRFFNRNIKLIMENKIGVDATQRIDFKG